MLIVTAWRETYSSFTKLVLKGLHVTSSNVNNTNVHTSITLRMTASWITHNTKKPIAGSLFAVSDNKPLL